MLKQCRWYHSLHISHNTLWPWRQTQWMPTETEFTMRFLSSIAWRGTLGWKTFYPTQSKLPNALSYVPVLLPEWTGQHLNRDQMPLIWQSVPPNCCCTPTTFTVRDGFLDHRIRQDCQMISSPSMGVVCMESKAQHRLKTCWTGPMSRVDEYELDKSIHTTIPFVLLSKIMSVLESIWEGNDCFISLLAAAMWLAVSSLPLTRASLSAIRLWIYPVR